MKKLLAFLFSFFSLLTGILHFIRLRTPWGLGLWFPKLLAEALSPYLVVIGAVGAGLGVLARAPAAILAGLAGMWASVHYLWKVTAVSADFSSAFTPQWPERLPPTQAHQRFLQKYWVWQPATPPAPRWIDDMAFWTLPGTQRHLLCDIWQPPVGVTPSGLGIIYCHGSAWYLIDKDYGTRPLFRYLAAQGHVIMDVAYRLAPETDVRGMVGDVKRAIAWFKANAAHYGVNPDRIVVGGGSAGAHLALLAAYTPTVAALAPEELRDVDLGVHGVFSFYGPTDMRAVITHHARMSHLGQRYITPPPPPPMPISRADPSWRRHQLDQFKRATRTPWDLFGGLPDEVPDMYDLVSPIHHVQPNSPPTLLIQGEHDLLVPVESARALRDKLLAAGASVTYLELPRTDHAFDFVLPMFSPPARASFYALERFLAWLM